MSLHLLDPIWFALMAVAVPLVVLGVSSFRAMSWGRRYISNMLRVAVCLLVCVALSGANVVREVDRLSVVAVVDLSGSVLRFFDPGVDKDARALTLWDRVRGVLDRGSNERRPDDLSAVIAFGSGPAVLISPQTSVVGEFVTEEPERLDINGGDGTDIGAALRLAAAIAPPGTATRIALFSDGVATSGDTEAAAGELLQARFALSGSDSRRVSSIPIDTITFDYAIKHEVMVESVEAISVAPSEATVRVRVTLSSSTDASGTLELMREGEAVDINGDEPGARRTVAVGPGRTTFVLPVRLPPGRVHRFEAIFTPDAGFDTVATNNRAQAITLTPGRASVLVVDGVGGGDQSGPGATLAQTLRATGVEVEMLPPSAISTDLLWLQRFDLVILQNVPADALADGVVDAITTYVTRFGGGLVMIGGPESFGAGGWKGTTIEPILPVVLDLPERAITPAAAVVIILDSSGSMRFNVLGTGRTQQMIANEGAAAAVETMDKTDLLGVITFNDEYEVLVPLALNGNPGATAKKVRAISPDGGTNLPPALDEAHRQLRGAKADLKHIIVLSDGVSMNTERLPSMVDSMRKDGIRVSTIAIGDGADTSAMSNMATRGDGTFFLVTDPSLLPRIFIKAVRVVRTPQIRLTPFTPRVLATGSPIVEGIADGEVPPLGGLVLTQPRLDRSVTTAMVAPTGEPLLAHWSAGVGHVAAFTSDAHDWSSAWVPWPGYARLWVQMVRAIARAQPDRGQELAVEIDGANLRVRVNAAEQDGSTANGGASKPRDGLSITGWVHQPGGTREPIVLTQTGPGEYESTVYAPREGSHIITLTPALNGKPTPPLVGGVSRSAGEEFRRLTSDSEAMRRLAEITGGRSMSITTAGDSMGAAPIDLFDRAGLKPAIARTPLWHELLIAIIAVYLLDIASRRIAWDRLISREFGSSLKRVAAESVQERGAQAVRAVRRLREVEARAPALTKTQQSLSKLSALDARAIVEAEAERRRQTRIAARAAARREPASTPEQAVDTVKTSMSEPTLIEGSAADPPPAPSLMEAKRRARRKMDDAESA